MTHWTATNICVNPSNQAWLDFVLPGGVGRRFLSLSCYFRAPYTDSFSSQVCVCEPKWTRKWEDTILRFLHGGVPKFPIAAQLFNLTWCEAVYKTKQNIHLINGLTAECEVMWFDSNGDQCLVKEMDRNAYSGTRTAVLQALAGSTSWVCVEQDEICHQQASAGRLLASGF